MVTSQNRHDRRGVALLRRRGLSDKEIEEQKRANPSEGAAAPGLGHNAGPPLGDPLLSAKATRQYCGDISEMTLWRWARELAFPPPDVVLLRKRFWRLSTIEKWIASQTEKVA